MENTQAQLTEWAKSCLAIDRRLTCGGCTPTFRITMTVTRVADGCSRWLGAHAVAVLLLRATQRRISIENVTRNAP
jgi:hypothetical protein